MPRLKIKTPVRRAAPATARFERRFVNGTWTVFDRHNFGHGPSIGTAKEALRIVGELNAGTLQWSA